MYFEEAFLNSNCLKFADQCVRILSSKEKAFLCHHCNLKFVILGLTTSLDSASYTFHRIRNLVKELEDLFGEVKRMIKMGKKNDAIDLLNANYEMVKEQLNAGTKGIEEAATLDILALGYMAVGDLKFVDYLLNLVFFLHPPPPLVHSSIFSHYYVLYCIILF